MKKLTLIMAVFILAFGLCCTTAQAANNNIKVTVDGKQIAFTDAKPFIDKNNRTQVPLRALGEALGCNVDYVPDFYHSYPDIILSKTMPNGLLLNLSFYTGSNSYTVDLDGIYLVWGKMDTRATMKNKRTFLPARYVAENLGYDVSFDSQTNTIVITKGTISDDSLLSLPTYKNIDFNDLQGSSWELKDFLNNGQYAYKGTWEIKSISDNYMTSKNDGYETTHKIDFNPHKGKIYLHGGKDFNGGTMIFFDKDTALFTMPGQDCPTCIMTRIN